MRRSEQGRHGPRKFRESAGALAEIPPRQELHVHQPLSNPVLQLINECSYLGSFWHHSERRRGTQTVMTARIRPAARGGNILRPWILYYPDSIFTDGKVGEGRGEKVPRCSFCRPPRWSARNRRHCFCCFRCRHGFHRSLKRERSNHGGRCHYHDRRKHTC